MRERSILFARPLVQAILAGRKTQTRRPIQPQPVLLGSDPPTAQCPFGTAGDRLWVREKWGYHRQFLDRDAKPAGPVIYAADGVPTDAHFAPWKPSLHMPRAACRIVLVVTSVRAERLHAITSEDAQAEGAPPEASESSLEWFQAVWDEYYAARNIGWADNPWVWVVAFDLLQPSHPVPCEALDRSSTQALRDELVARLNRQVSDTARRIRSR